MLSNILNAIRLSPAIQPLRDQIQTLFQNLPHFSLAAGVFNLAWRAVLVAEPAATVIFYPAPILAAPPPQGSLTVVSANLNHDFPRYRDVEARLEAFAALVEEQDADILLLQEVARTADFKVDAWLRQRLGMAYVYARANGHLEGIGFEEGVAIFSRYPLEHPEVQELSAGLNPFSRRIGLNAGIRLPDGTLEAFSVHLGISPTGNERQLQALQDWADTAATRGPVLIGGDFNAEPGSKRVQALQTAWTDAFLVAGDNQAPHTHTLSAPWGAVLREHRLDYIFLTPGPLAWTPLETSHLQTSPVPHSDHRIVVTRIRAPNLPDAPGLQPSLLAP